MRKQSTIRILRMTLLGLVGLGAASSRLNQGRQ